MTAGPPLKKIALYMLPLLLGNIFQQLYITVDAVIVGQILGMEALAAVGVVQGTRFVIFGFATGISGGVAFITARWVGAKEEENISRSIGAALTICGIAAGILTILGLVVSRKFLELMNTPAELLDRSVQYQNILLAGLICTVFYNIISGILRALGDSIAPLLFLVASSVLHIGFIYLFVLLLHMDVAGAGLAAVCSELSAGAGCFLYMIKKYPVARLKLRHWKTDVSWIWSHARMGLSMALQSSVTGIGMVIFQSALNGMGTRAVAAFTACGNIESYVIMPMFTVGNTLAMYTAQNYGAGKEKRIRQGVRACLLLNMIMAVTGGIAVTTFSHSLTEMFVGRNQQQVVELAGMYMSVVAPCYFIAALLFIYRAAMQGLGNALLPMVGGIMELVMRVLSSVLLAGWFGFTGLSLAYPLAWAGAAIPMIICYRKSSRRNFGIQSAPD